MGLSRPLLQPGPRRPQAMLPGLTNAAHTEQTQCGPYTALPASYSLPPRLPCQLCETVSEPRPALHPQSLGPHLTGAVGAGPSVCSWVPAAWGVPGLWSAVGLSERASELRSGLGTGAGSSTRRPAWLPAWFCPGSSDPSLSQCPRVWGQDDGKTSPWGRREGSVDGMGPRVVAVCSLNSVSGLAPQPTLWPADLWAWTPWVCPSVHPPRESLTVLCHSGFLTARLGICVISPPRKRRALPLVTLVTERLDLCVCRPPTRSQS